MEATRSAGLDSGPAQRTIPPASTPMCAGSSSSEATATRPASPSRPSGLAEVTKALAQETGEIGAGGLPGPSPEQEPVAMPLAMA